MIFLRDTAAPFSRRSATSTFLDCDPNYGFVIRPMNRMQTFTIEMQRLLECSHPDLPYIGLTCSGGIAVATGLDLTLAQTQSTVFVPGTDGIG